MSRTWRQRIIRVLKACKLERFIIGDGPSKKPITLTNRNVYILPTREGMIFVLILLTMLLAAFNYRNNLLFMLTFLLTGLGVVSMLHTWRNLVRLTFQAGRVSPVFAGETVHFQVQLNNTGQRARLNLQLRPDEHGENVQTVITDQPDNDMALLDLPCPATQRGLLDLGRFTISTRFPLGLFRAWSYLDLNMQAIIYPRPGKPAPLPPPEVGHTRDNAQAGEGMDDFKSLREYVPQDSSRHVHWKASARGQGMLTKEFAGEGTVERWLNWNNLANLSTEARLSQLCRWVLDSEQAGERYGLRLPGIEIAPTQGEKHLCHCLRTLALYQVRQQ